MSNSDSASFVVSVLVGDRVGILRDIINPLTDMGANIDGISQTVVGGYFTVVLTAAFDEPRLPQDIHKAITGRFAPGEAGVLVRAHEPRQTAPPPAGDRYVVTITGVDRRGILKAVTEFFAAKHINIEDWYFEYAEGKVTHIGEVTVPGRLDIKQVKDEFQQTLSNVGMTASMQHANIFRATNEIGSVSPLLRETHSHA